VKRGTIPPVSTFFPVTTPVNEPLVSSTGGPTLACSVWWTVHCDTNKADKHDDNVTSVNFFVISCQSKEERKLQIKYYESDRKIVKDAWGLVWPQIVIDHRAHYIPRPGSGTCRPPLTLLGDSSTMSYAARGLVNLTSRCGQGLLRPLRPQFDA
jgi:hypothetical protein